MSAAVLPAASSAGAMTIRTVTTNDLEAVVRLDEVITGTAKPIYWAGLFAELDATGRPGITFLVAELDGRVVGFIAGEVRAVEFGSDACGWVFGLDVEPGLRVKSVGTKLFDALCARFRASGITKVRTMLARDNDLVLAFFRSLGMMAGPFIQLEKDLD